MGAGLTVDWVKEAGRLFSSDKPSHFTNFLHCEECAEHDETLLNASIETIGMRELGNPSWDPLCFATPEGVKYYMPALIRLSLKNVDEDFYFGQLLFHLEVNGPDNALYHACSARQRQFIAAFVEYMILHYGGQLEREYYVDEAFRVRAIWSRAAGGDD